MVPNMNNLNMRRVLKQPTLRMADGGQPPPSSFKGMFNSVKAAFTKTPEEQARATALAEYQARAAAERAPAPAPARDTAAPMGSQNVLNGRMKAEGQLRNGGELRMNTGGQPYVPGFETRNPGVVANQATSPSPGAVPFSNIRSLQPAAPVASPMPKPVVAPVAKPAAPVPFSNISSLQGPQQTFAQANADPVAAATPGVTPVAKTTPSPMGAPTVTAGVIKTGPTSFGDSAAAQSANPSQNPITLREGGSAAIDRGMGGHVPGTGHGDKIPAKYEPGEFVVSNAMLDASPGLREELHDLRGNVLAQKGMTPAEADAKAVSGKTLRAATGGLDELWHNPETNTYEPRATGRQLAVAPQPAAPVQPGTALATTADVGNNGAKVNWVAGNNAAPMHRESVANKNVPPSGSAEARAFTASGAASNAPPPGAAPKPTPPGGLRYQAGHKLGSIAAEVAANPHFKTAVKYGVPLAKAVGVGGALYQGSKTADDIDAGNYAGAVDHAGLATASLAGVGSGPLGAARAGWAGAAYLGGHMAGTQIRKNMDDTQNDGVGYAVNELLRKSGNMVGQKWGVDDSAMLAIRDNGINATPADAEKYRAARTQAPVPAPHATATTANEDAAPPAAAAPSLRAPAAAPVDWAARKAERDALTQRDIALGNNMESSRLAKDAAHSAGVDQMVDHGMRMQDKVDQERALQGAETSAASVIGNREQFLARNKNVESLRGQQSLRLQQEGENKRLGLTNAAKLASDTMHNKTLLRGQDMVSADGRYGHELTYAANKGKMAYEVGKDQRDYARNMTNDAHAQRIANNEADAKNQQNLHAEFATFLPPTMVDGKPVADTNGAAQMATAFNAKMAADHAALSAKAKAGDRRAAAALEDLEKNKHAAYGPEEKRQFVNGMKLKNLASQYHSGALNPVGGRDVATDEAPTSMRKTSDGILGFGGEYKDNTGRTYPARAIETEDGSFLGGKTRTDLRGMIQR